MAAITATVAQSKIAASIFDAASELVSEFDARNEQAAEAKAARDLVSQADNGSDGVSGNNGKRLTILLRVAKLATSENWSSEDLATAMKLVKAKQLTVDGQNEPRSPDDPTVKTVGVFCSEISTFCHPSVRGQAEIIVTSATQAWKDEQAAIEAASDDEKIKVLTPVKTYKARLYQLVMGIVREIKRAASKGKDKDIVIRSSADVVAFAVAHDPKTLSDVAFGKCKNAANVVEKIYNEFHYEPLQTVIQYLRTDKLGELLETARLDHEMMLATKESEHDAKIAVEKAAQAEAARASLSLVFGHDFAKLSYLSFILRNSSFR
jgi:hypothetical protein